VQGNGNLQRRALRAQLHVTDSTAALREELNVRTASSAARRPSVRPRSPCSPPQIVDHMAEPMGLVQAPDRPTSAHGDQNIQPRCRECRELFLFHQRQPGHPDDEKNYANIVDRSMGAIPGRSLCYYLTSVSRLRGTIFDLDVVWGKGKDVIVLRLVGISHTSRTIRWYLTTVRRGQLSARQIFQAYRLRWLIELLFREICARQRNQLRPLACLHIARAFARDIIDALAAATCCAWVRVSQTVGLALAQLARELKPSKSRPRIALNLGTIGAQEIGHGPPSRASSNKPGRASSWTLRSCPSSAIAAVVKARRSDTHHLLSPCLHRLHRGNRRARRDGLMTAKTFLLKN
jgi:hypothetical protein